MKKLELNDPETKSADIVSDNITALKAVFPDAFREGKVDFDILKQLLGGALDEREEKYGLNWHGKRQARQIALTPSTGTLLACPDESVDWDTTQNLMIEGDNLEVLKLLQKSYAGKIKLIYIDPPYNTGKDFIYPDNFQDSIKNYLSLTGQTDSEGRKATSNTESSGRFHTDWLSMMYPRLKLARTLLARNGVIVISIDDRELSNLRALCNEIFGEENTVGVVVWKNATDNNPTNVATEHEYLLFVARSKEDIEKEWKSAASDVKKVLVKIGDELTSRLKGEQLSAAYDKWFREHKAGLWPLDRYKYIDEGGVYTGSQSVHNPGKEGYRYDVLHPTTTKPCKQPLMGYRFPKETMDELLRQGRILFGDDETKIIELKVYASEFQEKLSSLLELDGRLGAYDLKEDFPDEVKVFTNPKPVRLLNSFFPYLLKSDGDTVIDFFAGSASSGRALWELNRDGVKRKFVLVQLPEELDVEDKQQKGAASFCDKLGRPRNIAELTKERLRRVSARIKQDEQTLVGDLGFRVYKLAQSNIRTWQPVSSDLEGTLLANAEHIVPGRTEHDILYELLLKLGLELCVPIETRQIGGKAVHAIGGGALIACLADGLTKDVVESLAAGIVAWWKELAPAVETRIVFKDSGFSDDVAKTNMAAILNQNGILDVRSL
ncbi:site-specific DNA-methyltransferase [Agrobacterium larrymoorei]|uniref:site-specific DNA-methyltransferase n=1 Tax=Agrobacterium larrymoorei TaxID=160699 RepID=UPI0015725613|nr:site-specific DNA-methyltransferase [Agrobacterium larrymoorei]NTJ44887.1 site-specific DNA-methyltransferase [Agrobacterium larrymoorei]